MKLSLARLLGRSMTLGETLASGAGPARPRRARGVRLYLTLIAGILGFGGIAGASVEIAKIIFFVAVILFLVSAVVGLARGRRI